jgi:hypothetical protein
MQFLGKFYWRAVIFGLALFATGLLTFFPERHMASSSFTPSDREALGLSGTLGQLGAISSVFGNQAAVEVALRIGNSDAVRDQVIATTSLNEDLASKGRISLQRYLQQRVDIRSLRGGIIVIEMQNRNSNLAREIVAAYQSAVQEELGRVSRRQTVYKRGVLEQLVSDASDEFGRAQSAYDEFRLRNRYAEPRAAMAAIGDRVPMLESTIRGNEVALASARELYTDRNLTIRQMEAELSALRLQLAEAKSTVLTQDQGIGQLVQNSSRLYRLERDLEVAKSLYDSYVLYLRGTASEDLTSDANLRLLEPPHVDTERQLWLPGLALFIAIFLMWFAIEAYRLRPQPGGAVKETANA